MPRFARARFAGPLAALAAIAALAAGCPGRVPAPAAGAPDYQALAFVDVPFARVNAAGGNLVVARRDLDFDTRLGTVAVGATWNSAARDWRWSFEVEYDGAALVDASGARYDVAAVPDGAAIPGSLWVRLGARALRSKGGLVHEFDGEGRLAAVRWASGATPRIEYRRGATPAGPRLLELVQVSAPGESTVLARFGWDPAGRLASVEDRAGRRASFAWSPTGELVQARDAFDLARGLPGRRYSYAGGLLVSIETSERERAEYAYTDGRLASARAVGLGHPEHRFAYAARAGGGFETRVTDPSGAVRAIRWDASRRVTELVDATGARFGWSWSGLRPASHTGADGSVTRWSVADDEVVEERQASGRVVTFAYQPSGEDRAAPWRRPLRRASDALGLLEERSYDPTGRPVRVTNGAGEATSFGWSGQNLLQSVTDPSGLETRYENPGEHGHPRRIQRGELEETLDYDAVGNLLLGRGTGVLPPGVVSRGYDEDRNLARLELGDLDQVVVRETRTLAIEHRSDGQPTRIARPFGGDSELVYDALGRAAERRDKAEGVWRTTRLARDALGRIVAVERPNGMRATYQYDAAGRLTGLAHHRGGAFDGGASFTWRSGRLEEVRDAAHAFAVERYAYDAAGRLASIAYPGGESLELGYDGRSRVASERYRLASGVELRRLEHRYDGAGRHSELRDGATAVLQREYAAGRLALERFGNGLTRSYAYDGDGLLAEATLRTAAGALVERSTLEREPLSALAPGVAWRATTATLGAIAATTAEHYWLAPVGEGVAGARVGGFAHDPAGLEVEALAYDVLGNLLRVGNDGDPAARSFHYDDERTRLRRIRRGTGASVHEYAWDEAGFARERDGEAIAWDGGGRPVAVGTGSSFVWDAVGRPVSVTVNGVFVRMSFGGRVRTDAAGAPVAIELGALRIAVSGNHHYRHADFRGNVKLVTDALGRVVSHLRYAPYGTDLVHGAANPEIGFAQGRAAGGDLVLLGARLYDTDAGRFLAPDPVFQLVNQHAYAGGNPVWFWDPDGRESQESPTGFAVVVGVAGQHIGVALIAFGGPWGLTAGVGVYVISSGFLIGATAPDVGHDGFIRLGSLIATPLGNPWSGIGLALGGFAAGQATQRPPVAGPPQPKTYRGELNVVTPTTATAVDTATPGCSPATLASAPRADGLILPLAGVQLVLALVLIWERARKGSRGDRHGRH